MTNFEYYKDTILKLTNEGKNIAIVNDKPIACESVEYCTSCQLKHVYDNCGKPRMKWLCAEHTEQPKLNKKERQFCELVESGWICRDGDKRGVLHLANSKLVKDNNENVWMDEKYFHSGNWTCRITYIDEELLKISFPFITWEDEEPWSVEDLLKLEVEE